MKFTLTIAGCLMILCAVCQNVNGVWRGKLTQEPGGCYPEYYIELQIQHNGNSITGASYDYFDTTRFVKLNFDGRLNEITKKMVIAEHSVVEFRVPKDCIPCIKTYELTWSMQNNEESLTGTWKGMEMGSMTGCPPGKILLKRVNQSSFQTEPSLANQKAAVVTPAAMPPRKIEVVRTLAVNTTNIKVELYDSGQIDGDTISIFLNQQLILSKQGLTEKPITLNLPVQPGKDYELIMYAENLGSIPPNTALMIITSGKNKYEVYMSSSIQKSAAVKWRYEKPD